MSEKPQMTKELREWLNGLEASMASIAEDSDENPNFWAKIYGEAVRETFNLLQLTEKESRDTEIMHPNKKFISGKVAGIRLIYDLLCKLEKSDTPDYVSGNVITKS